MRFTVQVPIDPSWLPTDELRLYKGSENAADLASSTPAGGTIVKTASLGRAATGEAGAFFEISFDHRAANSCASLPIGVSCVDEAGNELPDRTELVIQLQEPPEPPGRPDVAAGSSPGEVVLSWSASPDLTT